MNQECNRSIKHEESTSLLSGGLKKSIYLLETGSGPLWWNGRVVWKVESEERVKGFIKDECNRWNWGIPLVMYQRIRKSRWKAWPLVLLAVEKCALIALQDVDSLQYKRGKSCIGESIRVEGRWKLTECSRSSCRRLFDRSLKHPYPGSALFNSLLQCSCADGHRPFTGDVAPKLVDCLLQENNDVLGARFSSYRTRNVFGGYCRSWLWTAF